MQGEKFSPQAIAHLITEKHLFPEHQAALHIAVMGIAHIRPQANAGIKPAPAKQGQIPLYPDTKQRQAPGRMRGCVLNHGQILSRRHTKDCHRLAVLYHCHCHGRDVP